MHHYETLEDLIHQATKMDQQLKRRSSYKKSSTLWMDEENFKMEEATSITTKPKEKEYSSAKITSQPTTFSSSHSSSIKCFKCLEKGHIVS